MAKPGVRLGVVQIAFGLGILALVARAAQIQLMHGARYAEMARSQRTQKVVLPARRGAIFDRNGVPLASTQESFHVGIAPNELKNPRRDAPKIAATLGVSPRELDRDLKRRYAYFNGPFSAARIEPLRGIRGVHLTAEFVRFYPDPRFARMLLGRPGGEGRPPEGIERVLDTVLARSEERRVGKE